MGALFCVAFPPTVVHAVVVSTGRSIGMAPLSLILAVGCYAMGGSEKRGFKNIKVYLRAVHVLSFGLRKYFDLQQKSTQGLRGFALSN